MIYSAVRYRRALKRKLRCCGDVRRELLEKFDPTLNAFLEDHPGPTEAELAAAFGPAEEMAKVMMEQVSEQEIKRYKRRMAFFAVIAGAVVVAFVLLTVYVYFLKENPVESYDWVYEETNYTQGE